MKNLILFLTYILSSLFVSAQTSTSIEEKAASVKADVQAHLKEYKKSTLAKVSDKNGDAASYAFKDSQGQLRLITLDNSDETGSQHVEYYFSDGKLCYTEQLKTGGDKKPVTEKFYLENEKLVKWLNAENQEVDPNSADFKAVDANLVPVLNKLKAKVK